MKKLDADTFLGLLSTKAAASRRPDGVTFELTYGCNLRCVHCYNPTHRALPHELTTSEICGLLNQIADLGVLTVTFTGGEPSVRPDIGEILHAARRQGLMIHLMPTPPVSHHPSPTSSKRLASARSMSQSTVRPRRSMKG